MIVFFEMKASLFIFIICFSICVSENSDYLEEKEINGGNFIQLIWKSYNKAMNVKILVGETVVYQLFCAQVIQIVTRLISNMKFDATIETPILLNRVLFTISDINLQNVFIGTREGPSVDSFKFSIHQSGNGSECIQLVINNVNMKYKGKYRVDNCFLKVFCGVNRLRGSLKVGVFGMSFKSCVIIEKSPETGRPRLIMFPKKSHLHIESLRVIFDHNLSGELKSRFSNVVLNHFREFISATVLNQIEVNIPNISERIISQIIENGVSAIDESLDRVFNSKFPYLFLENIDLTTSSSGMLGMQGSIVNETMSI